MAVTGTIFDIQKFSIHDGYGIRTTVFLKGCNNRCEWCHNPESLSCKPQLQFFANKCIGCGVCATVCKHGAFSPENGFDFSKCVSCGECAKYCCTGAREICGKIMTVEEVYEKIAQDIDYYKNSGGGVTFSGGEPLLQAEFIAEVSKKCKENGISVGIQTAGNVPFEVFEKIIPYTDFIMIDFKVFDNKKHCEFVGSPNTTIMQNLKKLSLIESIKLIVRTPIITDVNDTDEEIGNICNYIKNLKNLDYYELLRYHSFGLGKLENLNMPKRRQFTPPTDEKMKQLINIAKKYITNVKCEI